MSDVLRPGEDPGIYRAVLTRVDLWAITTHGSITNLGSIIRPRDESVDVQAKPGDYFPGTVLAELQSPQVSAKPGVLPQNGSPYISITRGRDSAVAAVLQVRPDTFSAEKWNFFLSDLKYLIKQGVAVALDASSVGVSFISSQGRESIADAMREHQAVLGVPMAIIHGAVIEAQLTRLGAPAKFVNTHSEAAKFLLSPPPAA